LTRLNSFFHDKHSQLNIENERSKEYTQTRARTHARTHTQNPSNLR